MGQTRKREIAILPGRSLTIFANVCLYTENGRCPYFPLGCIRVGNPDLTTIINETRNDPVTGITVNAR